MKNILLIITLISLSSCASMHTGVIFMADNLKKNKCDGTPLAVGDIDSFINPTVENIKELDKTLGYTDCVRSKPSSSSSLLVCNQPSTYKLFSSQNLAECNKFLLDNKL